MPCLSCSGESDSSELPTGTGEEATVEWFVQEVARSEPNDARAKGEEESPEVQVIVCFVSMWILFCACSQGRDEGERVYNYSSFCFHRLDGYFRIPLTLKEHKVVNNVGSEEGLARRCLSCMFVCILAA